MAGANTLGLLGAFILLAAALNDPLHMGADLLGLKDFHVTASFLNTSSGTLAIVMVFYTAFGLWLLAAPLIA